MKRTLLFIISIISLMPLLINSMTLQFTYYDNKGVHIDSCTISGDVLSSCLIGGLTHTIMGSGSSICSDRFVMVTGSGGDYILEYCVNNNLINNFQWINVNMDKPKVTIQISGVNTNNTFVIWNYNDYCKVVNNTCEIPNLGSFTIFTVTNEVITSQLFINEFSVITFSIPKDLLSPIFITSMNLYSNGWDGYKSLLI